MRSATTRTEDPRTEGDEHEEDSGARDGCGPSGLEISGDDGKLWEVTVDAGDGRVLGQEMEEEEGGYDDQGSDDQDPEDAG